jgi:hypothetical protein
MAKECPLLARKLVGATSCREFLVKLSKNRNFTVLSCYR